MLRYLPKGPLAHLVERIHGMDEVSGSSPLGSTDQKTAQMGGFLLCLQFPVGLMEEVADDDKGQDRREPVRNMITDTVG